MAKDRTGQPDWPTTMRMRLPDGRWLGTDGSVWLARSVPLAPVVDAASPAAMLSAAEPLIAAFEELSAITPIRLARRSASRSSYRQVQILMVNLPRAYDPPPGHPIADYLRESFAEEAVDRRVVIFAVKLEDKLGGGGLRSAIDSVVEIMLSGSTPLSDFDRDFKAVDAALARAGLGRLSTEESRIANAWWNHGLAADTPTLVHEDHLHIFTGQGAASAVARMDPGKQAACDEWITKVPNQHTLTFASVQDFELPYVPATSGFAQWASFLIDRSAVAVSIRGRVEPSNVTRMELRRRRKQYLDDINERLQQGKMERAEQEEQLQQLEDVENEYAGDAHPTLIETSVVVALNGKVDDVEDVGRDVAITLSNMQFRQQQALDEMMLCSPVRANPNLHDLPCQAVGYSGLPSLSTVGDPTGAQLGFTERDRQPAYISPTAASTADGLPIALVAGATGSGKLLTLSTKIPTPSGWTTMGDLKVGDEVLGRDGRPCRVTFVSEINEHPDLYAVRFADGQVIHADREHQWVVSDRAQRNAPRKTKHLAAIENWEAARAVIAGLLHLAQTFEESHESTLDELWSLVSEAGLAHRLQTKNGLYCSLSFVQCPYRADLRAVTRMHTVREIRKTDPVLLFPVARTLRAAIAAWQSLTGSNKARWGASAAGRCAAARAVLARVSEQDEMTAPEIIRALAKEGARPSKPGHLRATARAAGITPRSALREVVVAVPEVGSATRAVSVYPTQIALKSLAMRLDQQYGSLPPSTEAAEQVMTTAEMLAAGIRAAGGQAQFAVQLPCALDLPDRELPVSPYALGVWLGDGAVGTGTISQGESAACTDGDGLTDRAFLIAELNREGVEAHASASSTQTIGTRRLATRLGHAGVLKSKHVPVSYLRASAPQRLALLQGLMDTDGTIDANGSCELCFCDERLATDSLELIRSLGIKCTIASGDSVITENDPDNPGSKRRRITGTRYRMHFTTDLPVFRLPRKVNRLPRELRPTAKWNYIVSVEPIRSVAGRCITVDSADSTYLAEGFVPTHNTQILLWLANQIARMRNDRGENQPVIIIDPKALALDTPVPTPSGWSRIGELAVGDTVFGRDGVPCTVTHKSRVFAASETRVYDFHFDDGQVVRADANHQWVVYANNDRPRLLGASAEDIARWRPEHCAWARTARELAEQAGDSRESGTYELVALLREHGVTKWAEAATVGAELRTAGLVPGGTPKSLRWPTGLALKALADALSRDADSPYGQTLTTADILARGVDLAGQSRFAIPVPVAVELPEAHLPIDPYLLGVWLGDGIAKSNGIACGDADLDAMAENIGQVWPRTHIARTARAAVVTLDRDFEHCLYGHNAYAKRTRNASGAQQVACTTCQRQYVKAYADGQAWPVERMVNPTFIHLLRSAGVYRNKHIPAAYLRASRAQRLALLQGLMDTDGTVKKRGDLRITMTNERLMRGVCELVRSLGIKATIWGGDATITERDPANHESTHTRVVGREWVVTFRTTEPVFRLPSKLHAQTERCRDTDSVRSQFVYLAEVREVASQPMQCIRVDSPDHTYLVGDFVVTHNTGSNLSDAVAATGGQVLSLDSLAAADGAFDPMRFTASTEAGVDLAASMLLSVNPWGSKREDYETPLQRALMIGARAGATCIGQALQYAAQYGGADPVMVQRVFDLAESSPMFRACVGINPGTAALREAQGITMIKVGNAHLDLPEPGADPKSLSQGQRVAMALVRMMVFGSAMALTGRQGVVMLDEAWVFLGAGRSEVERLGRLARSQGVLPMLFTQRVTDALNAGLAGYISRGLILPIRDKDEAVAACELFNLEPTPARIKRITARATIGEHDSTAWDWNSMSALVEPGTRRVRRGAIAIYADLHGRAVPVEIVIPKVFMDLASTNPEDIKRREAGKAARQRELAVQQAASVIEPVPAPLPAPVPVPAYAPPVRPAPAVAAPEPMFTPPQFTAPPGTPIYTPPAQPPAQPLPVYSPPPAQSDWLPDD